MKTTFIITAFLTFSIVGRAQDSTDAVVQADSISQSYFWGIYKTHPILTNVDKKELNQKKIEITREIEKTKQILSHKIKADTVSVPGHTTLFGGLITIPKINDKQEQAKRHKKDIQNLEEKQNKLKSELKKIKALEKKIENFMRKIYFGDLLSGKLRDNSILNTDKKC